MLVSVKLNAAALAVLPVNPGTSAATVGFVFIKSSLSATIKKQS